MKTLFHLMIGEKDPEFLAARGRKGHGDAEGAGWERRMRREHLVSFIFTGFDPRRRPGLGLFASIACHLAVGNFYAERRTITLEQRDLEVLERTARISHSPFSGNRARNNYARGIDAASADVKAELLFDQRARTALVILPPASDRIPD